MRKYVLMQWINTMIIHFFKQIGNIPSNLRIIDYSHGLTGSAHDSVAFEYTGAGQNPEWFFEGEEFALCDSAYTVNKRTISVHKEPASLIPENALFDKAAAHLQIRSEHCMGALKGRFQCLRGLRVSITSNDEHVSACVWITIAIILHNLVIDVEGLEFTQNLLARHTHQEEEEDRGPPDYALHPDMGDGEAKRQRLVNEIVAYRISRDE